MGTLASFLLFFFSIPPTFSKGDALGVGKTLRIRLWLLNRSPCLRPPLIFHGDIRDSQKPSYLQTYSRTRERVHSRNQWTQAITQWFSSYLFEMATYESFSLLRYLYTSATLTEKERAIKTVENGMIFPGRGRIVYKQEPIQVNHIKTISDDRQFAFNKHS